MYAVAESIMPANARGRSLCHAVPLLLFVGLVAVRESRARAAILLPAFGPLVEPDNHRGVHAAHHGGWGHGDRPVFRFPFLFDECELQDVGIQPRRSNGGVY